MGKLNYLHQPQTVFDHISKLEPTHAEVVSFLRKTILDSSPDIGEHIKWNSPSFFYKGSMKPFDPKEYKRDTLVLNLHKGKILLVFPTGAVVHDHGGLLEGSYTDGRRIVTIQSLADAKEKAFRLQEALRQWLAQVET